MAPSCQYHALLACLPDSSCNAVDRYNYTSGWVDSQYKFSQQFGRFDISARLPGGNFCGIGSAHWLMPADNVCWPTGGEIDIMEHWLCEQYGEVFGTLHYGPSCGNDTSTNYHGAYPDVAGGAQPIDFSADFHVFSVEWDTEQISWFVDGNFYVQRYQNDTHGGGARIPQTPFYIILNTPIPWYYPAPQSDWATVFHVIDYVRVYQAAPSV